MKPSTSYPITVAAVLAAGVLGASELPATASSRLTPVPHPLANPQTTLIAGRLGFKLNNLRPSRFNYGGFTRSSCPPVDITVVAPPTRPEERPLGQKDNVAVDSTASPHPTLFVNIPAELSGKTAELTLQNEAGDQQLYSTTFNLTGKPGIVGIRIPNTAPPLTVGQKYLWQVAVNCSNPNDRINAGSWIERVPLDRTLASQLDRATAREKPVLYAEAGIWQDTVSTLAELLYHNPNDQFLAQDWANLMQSVNLNDFANKPIVQIAGQ